MIEKNKDKSLNKKDKEAVVANETIKGINAEKFLILPHKQVEKYIQGKAFDYDSWIEAGRELAP